MSAIAVLILAAGKSSRMKAIKQLAKIEDKYLLEIAIEKAKAITKTNTFCVLGANSEIIKTYINFKNVQVIYNDKYESGLSSSIVCGINFIKKTQPKTKAIFILLGDQPAIHTDYLNEMLHLYKENPSKIIASNYNGTYGVPALIPKIYFDDLLDIQGDKGAKKFLNSNMTRILSPKKTTNLIDIDTKEQLILYRNR